jgi:hypothetical protein
MGEAMRVHGACHCGAIAFEATVDAGRVLLCHCTACQTLSGTAYRTSAPATGESFRLLRGTPKTYVKTAESGNRRAQVFCADCGTPLYAHADVAAPERYIVRVGCLAEREALVPSARIWCRSALPWSQDLEGLRQAERE